MIARISIFFKKKIILLIKVDGLYKRWFSRLTIENSRTSVFGAVISLSSSFIWCFMGKCKTMTPLVCHIDWQNEFPWRSVRLSSSSPTTPQPQYIRAWGKASLPLHPGQSRLKQQNNYICRPVAGEMVA